jgi:serine/threonine protein kinase
MIETGKVLQGRYRIDRKIGQGGMGAVYIATDERFGSLVAIKETLLMDDSYRKAIEREARLLNSLKHSALPRVSDHFLEAEGQFLVMEYVPGEDLGTMMEGGHAPFSVDEVLEWADQLLDALDFLHNQKIPVIHRDIKPQNLKLNARGQIILLDFGLAKGNPTDAGGHHTAAKSIFGYSKNYASLEQIQGTGTDPRSDLYSLAATLYHLLTGVPPEDALTRAMAVLGQQPDPLQPADAIRSEIPHGVAVVLQMAMDLNARLRPASAREMRQMLRNHAEYADRVLPVANAAFVASPDFSSQKTKLLHHDTLQEGGKLTDVKTAIMPQNISQETRVRTTPRRKNRVAAAVLGAILIVGGAIAGTYVYDPALFGASSESSGAVPAVEPEPAAVIQSAENSDANTVVESTANVSNAATAAVPATTAPKAPDASRPTKAAGASQKTQVGNEAIVIEGDTIRVGNMRIRNGVIETPSTYIDENGIRRKIPSPKAPAFPALSPEQLQKLTPEERIRLREYLRNQYRPPPAPTPQ